MKRDKIISIRVNSELLKKFENIVKSYTEKYKFRDKRNHYFFRNPTNNFIDHRKFTVADLLEDALMEYCNTIPTSEK